MLEIGPSEGKVDISESSAMNFLNHITIKQVTLYAQQQITAELPKPSLYINVMKSGSL
jgi:hypothetical protein